MRELARALGISKGGLYHYIGSKDDILFLILEFNVDNMMMVFEQTDLQITNLPPAEALRTAIRTHLESVDEHQDMYIFVNHVMPNLGEADRRKMFEASELQTTYFENLISNGVGEYVFAVNDSWLLASNIVSYCYRWAHHRWTLRKRYTLEEYVGAITGQVMETIMMDKHLSR